jgi:hypothetical protein
MIAAFLVPVARLDAEEYAYHHDGEIDRHRWPIVPAQMSG